MTGLTDKLYNASPAWMQNVLVSAYGYKLFRKRYTGPVFRQVRADIERVNAMTAREQAAFQAERLHEMIKHCRTNVPYYSNLMAELGLTEQDFTEAEHLTKLPILDKQPLRDTPELFRARGSTPYMIQHTSGSTGTPLSLWVNEYTYKLAMALLIDHEERHGVKFGAKRATFAGRMIQPIDKMKPPFSRYNRAENQRLFSAYHINDQTFSYYKNELDGFQPEELIGYPSAIYDLATQYLDKKVRPGFKPKAIITNSETLLEWQRDTIESVFDCNVFDYYGTAEYVTFASQCKAGNYHFHPSIGITEVTTSDREVSLKHEPGDVLASSLTNTTMPLLRYRIGDTSNDLITNCLCKNPSQHTNQIYGRIDDVIVTPDGRRIGRIDHIFKGLTGIREAQVVQETPGSCTIKIVTTNAQNKPDEGLILANFRHRLGDEMSLTFNYVDAIERSANGKFRSVLTNLRDK